LRLLGLCQHILNMDNLLCPGEATQRGFRMGTDHWFALPQLSIGRRRAVERNMPEPAIFIERHGAEVRLAYARRVFQHRLENRLQLAGRAGDHLQHFGSCRLLLKRFAQIVRALPQLVEQPRVLDGDDGLGGEVLD